MNTNRPNIPVDPSMPSLRPFSYDKFLKLSDATNHLPYDAVYAFINDFDYEQIENLVLLHLDHLDGVKSSIEVAADKFPTGIGMVRDASNALPLNKRLSPDDTIILKENLLLRALGLVRGIDHVLKYQSIIQKKPIHDLARIKLRDLYQQFFLELFKDETVNLKQIQKKFNKQVVELLHDAKIDTGIESREDYKKILGHYRDLAALLNPAKSLVTILKQTVNDVEITQTETSHPITKKTDAQKIQLDVMSEINVKRFPNDFHSSKKIAFQLANQAFYELMKMDDRRLPAQSRKTIGPTLKNAYSTQNKIEFKNGDEVTSVQFTALRSGSLAYIGQDDSESNIAKYADENLLQLRKAAGNKLLHVTLLVTNTSFNQQNMMISVSQRALEKTHMYYSYIPINVIGLMDKPKLSPVINDLGLSLPEEINPNDLFNRTSRITLAAHVINLFFNVGNTINLTTCASGQDRTGTAMEAATQVWLSRQYEYFRLPMTKPEIEDMRAIGCHNVVLASLAVPGSPGMKKDSEVANYFSDLTNKYFYRAVANTNKYPPLEKAAVNDLKNEWNRVSSTPFQKFLTQLEKSEIESEIRFYLLQWVEEAISQCEEKKFTDVFSLRFMSSKSAAAAQRAEVIDIVYDLRNGIVANKVTEDLFTNLNEKVLSVHTPPSELPDNLNTVFTQLKQILIAATQKYNEINPDSTLIRRQRS